MSVAALGPIVQRAAEQGDAVATRILERAAEELVLAARSVATRLEMRGDAFTFYLAGGVFRVVPVARRRAAAPAGRGRAARAGAGARRGAGGRRGLARARRGARRRAGAAGTRRQAAGDALIAASTDRASASSTRRTRSRARWPRDIARHAGRAARRWCSGLPTGRTPIPLYRELVRLHRAGRADFSARDHVQPRRVPRPRRRRPAQLSRVHAAAPVRPRQPARRGGSTS